MAQFRIVPQKDWDVLSQYLESPIEVLIPEEVFNQLNKKDQEKLVDSINSGCCDDYNCGGDPDLWVDVVHTASHMALQLILHKDDIE